MKSRGSELILGAAGGACRFDKRKRRTASQPKAQFVVCAIWVRQRLPVVR